MIDWEVQEDIIKAKIQKKPPKGPFESLANDICKSVSPMCVLYQIFRICQDEKTNIVYVSFSSGGARGSCPPKDGSASGGNPESQVGETDRRPSALAPYLHHLILYKKEDKVSLKSLWIDVKERKQKRPSVEGL